MRISAVVVACALLASCASTNAQTVGGQATAAMIPAAGSALVSVPNDGSFEGKQYNGSGQMTAQAVNGAFTRVMRRIVVAPSSRSLEEDLASARAAELDFVIVPQIVHWEDRATEWSGKLDRLTVKLEIYDARNGALITAALIEGKSAWATFGGDHPQDLLPAPLNEYAASVVRPN